MEQHEQNTDKTKADHDDCEHCGPTPPKIKLGKKLKITGILFIAVIALSYLPFLSELNESLIEYLKLIWWAILLGLVIGGVIDYFIPQEFIYKIMGRRRKRSLLFAVMIGLFMSACSHGILAIAIQLYKKGANIPSVITFLLASPWANLPVTILLFGFFGWKAFLFVIAAMIIALVTGGVFMLLERYKLIEQSRVVEEDKETDWTHISKFSLKGSVRGISAGTMHLSNMVLWWILIGVVFAAVIGAYVPAHIFVDYFGATIAGLFLTLLFATIIEVCSEGSAPIAFEIFSKVGVLGNPFVFLMAGVATDYTEIGLIWSNIGKKTAIWLPIVTIPQIIAIGLLFNAIL